MTLTTTLDPPLAKPSTKWRKQQPRMLKWYAACFGLCAGLMVAGYLVIQWRNAPPEAIVPINWPEPTRPDSPPSKIEPAPHNNHSLHPAPDPRLIEALPIGLLPKIGEDGTRPADIYARPVTPVSGTLAEAPRVAILITGGGIGHLATVEAMIKLPADISIAISPYSSDIDRQAADIRNEGHEIFLDLPVGQPSVAYGGSGPYELDDRFDVDVNHTRLRWAMSRFPGYVGIAGHFQDRLKRDGTAISTLSEIGERGLKMFDLGHPNGPRRLDSDLRTQAIDTALGQLEETARLNGQAIGLAGTTPLAIDRIKNWSAGLTARGFRLVPVSALLHGNGAK